MSVEFWFGSNSDDEGRLPPCFVLFSSSALTRGDLRSTGEGVGESVPVQLSLRFCKMSYLQVNRLFILRGKEL